MSQVAAFRGPEDPVGVQWGDLRVAQKKLVLRLCLSSWKWNSRQTNCSSTGVLNFAQGRFPPSLWDGGLSHMDLSGHD